MGGITWIILDITGGQLINEDFKNMMELLW